MVYELIFSSKTALYSLEIYFIAFKNLINFLIKTSFTWAFILSVFAKEFLNKKVSNTFLEQNSICLLVQFWMMVNCWIGDKCFCFIFSRISSVADDMIGEHRCA